MIVNSNIAAALVSILFITLPSQSEATGKKSLPRSFFGVKLGTVVKGKHIQKNLSEIVNVTRMEMSDMGLIVSFEPITPNPMFPLIKRPREKTEIIDYSYNLILTPLVPRVKFGADQLKDYALYDYEISRITWSSLNNIEGNSLYKSEAYMRVKELCEAFEKKLNVAPKSINSISPHYYKCSFVENSSKLSIDSAVDVHLEFSYDEKTMNRKRNSFRGYLEEILMEELLQE